VSTPPATLLDALAAVGVIDRAAPPPMTALTGGVSSEIWRIDVDPVSLVAKQALARLRVRGDWCAPVERTRYEAAWMRAVERLVPGATPRLVAASDDVIVMEYLAADVHPAWKAELLAGHVDDRVAAELGSMLATIHDETSGDETIRSRFDSAELFEALRLRPYFGAAAAAHPDLAGRFDALRSRFWTAPPALVHGDVSPKNVLCGPRGPVLLDAECATWGDPAFDVAFCSTHLLLKMVAVPDASDALAAAFDAFTGSYLQRRGHAGATESGAAAYLGGLLLARVDGLSPVEYLTPDQQRVVRGAAVALVADTANTLAEVASRWRRSTSRAARSRRR
jgi:aminoglycoside phosphotransferase (APT) family kinase protein